MMNLKVYSVFDKGIMAYMRPFFMQAHGQAIRGFEDLVRDKDSDIGRHPEDYSLFYLGDFDDHSGELEKCEPMCLARAHELASVIKERNNGS